MKISKSKFVIAEPELLEAPKTAAKRLGIPESKILLFSDKDDGTHVSWRSLLSHGSQDWVSFDDMFNNNKYNMQNGCEDGIPQNSDQEIGDIYNAIQQIAAQSKVDHRYILAEILQESTGCVRVQTTKAPEGNIYNPGLMQDFDGYYTCNCEQNDEYNENCGLVNPCPQGKLGSPSFPSDL